MLVEPKRACLAGIMNVPLDLCFMTYTSPCSDIAFSCCQARQRVTDEQVQELTERVSALHRENDLLESALQAARAHGGEVRTGSSMSQSELLM